MALLTRINPDATFARSVADSLARTGLPADGTIIYRGRNIVLSTDRPARLCYKSFSVPSAIKAYIYGAMRTPKALRAYDNALKLRGMGIDTPEPVAAVCVVEKARLRQSYYVCRMLEGWTDLRGAEKRSDFEELAKALARFMNTLHCAGVLMKDFSPGNILFLRDDNRQYRFALIDINRMEFGISDRRVLMSNFGTALDTAAGVAVLAREYAALQSDSAAAEQLANSIYARRQRALLRKKRIKNLFRHKK